MKLIYGPGRKIGKNIMEKKLLSFALILLVLGCGQSLEKDSLRSLSEGKVIGVEGENNTYTWKGIPFAKPPTDELRWKAPQDPAKWQGILELTEFKSSCFQGASGIQGDTDAEWTGSEDCLYLNVWTPKLTQDEIKNSTEKLPVMMWIHGGGNTVGSAHIYDPSLLVSSHNVIVVTIHYRMGPLGWFRHPSLYETDDSKLDISGNYGTLDTIKALEWIKKNISTFGGDPNNVTVFGESAGGHNTAAIFSSPLSEGLYHKVIVQSGIMSTSSIEAAENYLPESGIAPSTSGLEVFNHILVASNKARDLKDARTLQDQMSKEEIKSTLYETEPDILIQASRDSRPKRSGMTRVYPDGHVILKGGIEAAFTNPALSRVPIISGTNKDENKFFNSMNRNFVKWGPANSLYKAVGIDEMPLEILDLDYYEAINFYGSAFWKQRAVDTPASQLIKSGHTDTYAYRFDWDELPVIEDMDFSKLIGAAHALEILFVFGSFDSYIVKNYLFADGSYLAGKKLSDQIQSYWAEFAYTGNPGKGRDGSLPKWSAWQASLGPKYMVLDSENDQGLYMSEEEYTQDYLLNKLSSDDRLDKKQKCETLFGLSYGDGNGVSPERFNKFMDGSCANRDYSGILDMIESSDDDDSEGQDN